MKKVLAGLVLAQGAYCIDIDDIKNVVEIGQNVNEVIGVAKDGIQVAEDLWNQWDSQDYEPMDEWEAKGDLNQSIETFLNKYDSEDMGAPTVHSTQILLAERCPNPQGILDSDAIQVKHKEKNLAEDALQVAREKLVKDLKKNAKGETFAHLISIEAVSPLLASAVKQIQTWGHQINQSAETATGSLPGSWPKRQRALQYADKKAREVDVAKLIFKRMGIEGSIGLTGNISNQGGTLIIIPPSYKQEIATLQKTRAAQISKLFAGIREKLIANEDLSQAENQLIQDAAIPAASLITLLTQYKGTGADLALQRFSHLIAFDQVMQFAEELVQNVLYHAKALQSGRMVDYPLDEFVEQVEGVQDGLAALKQDHQHKLAAEQEALDTMLKIDQKLREQARDL